jgi:hypothetical protein
MSRSKYMRRSHVAARCGLATAAALASLALAGDWPVFRGGPLQTGASSDPLPNPLVVRWSFKAQDAFEGSAAIVGDVAYVGSMDEHVYALEVSTGRKLWSQKLGPIKVGTAVRGGSVYVERAAQMEISGRSRNHIGREFRRRQCSLWLG